MISGVTAPNSELVVSIQSNSTNFTGSSIVPQLEIRHHCELVNPTLLVQVLATADTEELNFILLNVNCAALAEVVSQITMEMLTGPDQRLPELQVLARLVSTLLL